MLLLQRIKQYYCHIPRPGESHVLTSSMPPSTLTFTPSALWHIFLQSSSHSVYRNVTITTWKPRYWQAHSVWWHSTKGVGRNTSVGRRVEMWGSVTHTSHRTDFCGLNIVDFFFLYGALQVSPPSPFIHRNRSLSRSIVIFPFSKTNAELQ
jgi:hypothetical protein